MPTNRYYTTTIPTQGAPGTTTFATLANMEGNTGGASFSQSQITSTSTNTKTISWFPDGDGTWPTNQRIITQVRAGSTCLCDAGIVTGSAAQAIINGIGGDNLIFPTASFAEQLDTFVTNHVTLTDASIQNGTVHCQMQFQNQSGSSGTYSVSSLVLVVDWIQGTNVNRKRKFYRRGAC